MILIGIPQTWQPGRYRVIVGGVRRADEIERAQLAQLEAWRLDEWRADIVVDGGGGAPIARTRGAYAELGSQAQRQAVIRVHPQCNALLADNPSAMMEAVLDGYLAAGGPHTVCLADHYDGLQIDWDVPERLLPAYADWLTVLRQRLPSEEALTVTGLVVGSIIQVWSV